jgi:hypothetical protein
MREGSYKNSRVLEDLAGKCLDWQERIEVLHVAGGYRSPDDFASFVGAVCGAIACPAWSWAPLRRGPARLEAC